MNEIMYELPEYPKVKKLIIDKDIINGTKKIDFAAMSKSELLIAE